MAASGLEQGRVLDAALADFRPARMVLRVVAVEDKDRRVLDGGDLVGVAPKCRLDRNQDPDLFGSRLQYFEPKTTHGGGPFQGIREIRAFSAGVVSPRRPGKQGGSQ